MRPIPVLRRIALAAALVSSIGGGPAAQAAGFQLNESSASGLGNAFAGGAAAAEDASTLWSNVAGLSRLRGRQAVLALHLITPTIRFKDGGSLAAPGQPVLGTLGGDAGGLNVVPNAYLVLPLSPALTAGVGFTAPWGLVTEYDRSWIGRFQATRSSIQTLNINPGIAWQLSPGVSLGLGLNAQRMLAEFNNQVNYSGALLQAAGAAGLAPATIGALATATAGLESRASVKGSDNAWGWNIGALWALDAGSRVGLHYRSAVTYTIAGQVAFSHPALPAIANPALAGAAAGLDAALKASVLADGAVHSRVKLPAIVNLSYVGGLGPRWTLMADAQWTQWSTIQELAFIRADGTVLQRTPEAFKDSWKLALGVNYRPGGAWLWRGGLAFDQTPVRDAYRTPRLPDAHRTWLAGGVQRALGPTMTLDLGAAYLFARRAGIDSSVHLPASQGAGVLRGRYDNHTVIVSGQLGLLF